MGAAATEPGDPPSLCRDRGGDSMAEPGRQCHRLGSGPATGQHLDGSPTVQTDPGMVCNLDSRNPKDVVTAVRQHRQPFAVEARNPPGLEKTPQVDGARAAEWLELLPGAPPAHAPGLWTGARVDQGPKRAAFGG